MAQARIWDIRATDEDAVQTVAQALELREPVARLLVQRGQGDPEQARFFLHGRLSELPDPFLMAGMQAAVERIERAIREHEPIMGWGDYDVDGVTSLSLLGRFFKQIDVPIELGVPLRREDGYGLKTQAVEEMARRGIKLIITVDNGIVSVDEVALAARLGMDVIVVDHHELGPVLPAACAILNPKQPGCTFPYDDPAACGLTFMLLAGLRRHLVTCGLLEREKAPNLKEHLDLAALGTVADMVPLTGLNRLLVRFGLPYLSRSRHPGVMALKEVCGLDIDADVDSYTVGFMMGPRLNAGGRLGDAMAGVNLLTTEDLQQARELATLLNRRNQVRRQLETRVVDEALEMVEAHPEWADAPVLVLGKRGWHEGVVGLAASRLVEKLQRPAVVIGFNDEGLGRGSCRSIPAFHIQEALARQTAYLEQFGGHAQAAGLTIREERLEAFRDAFVRDAAERLTPADFIPRLQTDGPCSIDLLDYGLLDQFQALAPFGMNNPAPAFIEHGARVQRARLLKKKHWKFGLAKNGRSYDAIAFGMGETPVARGDCLDIVYVPEYNTYRGEKTIQLRIKDLVRSEP